ncbi:endonuclease III domain-containing protein [Pseudorhodoplanes sinuspersici]|uniref:Uncharacterized protein n=1 Tax=Pseudorhodoplanes sinuspersici TaxID=1235591 RepID=A0A1W6ZW46_9HYPH|nr:hypothetical protein [Pseudorhodoplanes sinuspersici]ARQ00985.1 hypothetical protein CAK95_19215 [Pseudorhodoplanes sinuspersici]RKE72622.1 endonuclease-3 [Pseudorhodoplanes sinuspersici]
MQLTFTFEREPILLQIRNRLVQIYGQQRDELRHEPTPQWVKAMISSRTLDAISDGAFVRLRGLPSWDMLAQMKTTEITPMIHDVTFAQNKAIHLAKSAQIIKRRRGTVELDFLADWPTQVAFDWLNSLPGTGPKVACVTLNFSTLRRPVFAIDTHVLRVFWRLGLAPNRHNFKRGYITLSNLIPNNWDADDLYELHWLMKYLGQKICTHERPLCGRCPLASLCPSAACLQA